MLIFNSNGLLKKIAWASAGISGSYLLLAVIPPFLYHVGSPLASAIRGLGGAICHQRPSRCFWIFDYPCSLCTKCCGVYFGVFVTAFVFIIYRKLINTKTSIYLSVVLFLVLFDSFLGYSSSKSKNFVYVNFFISAIGAVGAYSLLLNKIALGGHAVEFVSKRFFILLFAFVLLDLYGFSKAFGEPITENNEGKVSITIPASTGVVLGIVGEISTKYFREGDAVPLRVVSPVKVKDTTVIRGGSPARGVLAVAHAASSWGGAGELVIEAKSVQAIDGTEILITGTTSRHGETSHGTSAAVAVGTGLLCLPLALTGAAVKGEEGRVMPGFELVARTLNDQTITIPSEAEQQRIQKQQEALASQQKADAALREQQLKEEQKKKKHNKNSSNGDN